MTDEKFSELVNLFLDQEISSSELETLKAELAANADRKAEFTERCRLHQAMRLALGVPVSFNTQRGSVVRGAGDNSRNGAPVAAFPRWILGAGLAASMAVGGVLFFRSNPDTTYTAKQNLEAVEEEELFEEVDRSDLKRFANTQQEAIQRAATLAAELRLLGLRPEVTSGELALEEVSFASIQPRDVRRRQIDIFNQLKDYSPIPEPVILESANPRPARSAIWPAGFKTSLATFK